MKLPIFVFAAAMLCGSTVWAAGQYDALVSCAAGLWPNDYFLYHPQADFISYPSSNAGRPGFFAVTRDEIYSGLAPAKLVEARARFKQAEAWERRAASKEIACMDKLEAEHRWAVTKFLRPVSEVCKDERAEAEKLGKTKTKWLRILQSLPVALKVGDLPSQPQPQNDEFVGWGDAMAPMGSSEKVAKTGDSIFMNSLNPVERAFFRTHDFIEKVTGASDPAPVRQILPVVVNNQNSSDLSRLELRARIAAVVGDTGFEIGHHKNWEEGVHTPGQIGEHYKSIPEPMTTEQIMAALATCSKVPDHGEDHSVSDAVNHWLNSHQNISHASSPVQQGGAGNAE